MKEYIQDLEKLNNRQRGEYIKNFLNVLGVPLRTQPFRAMFASGENIIVDYPFNTPLPSDLKYILLSAHFNKWFNSPGANDNASGVAVLMELVKRLKSGAPVSDSLRIVFFDLEDGPAITAGSRYYIKTEGLNNLDRVYNLDMVGTGDTLIVWPAAESARSEAWLKPLDEAAQVAQMPIVYIPKAELTFLKIPVKVSDHLPFIRNGFRKACSLGVVYNKDVKFLRQLEQSTWYYLWARAKYILTGKGELPKTLQLHHSSKDLVEFIEESTLEKVLKTVWRAAIK